MYIHQYLACQNALSLQRVVAYDLSNRFPILVQPAYSRHDDLSSFISNMQRCYFPYCHSLHRVGYGEIVLERRDSNLCLYWKMIDHLAQGR